MNTMNEHPEVRRILQAIIEDTQAGIPIHLSRRERYSAVLGHFRVLFEGEDDLLHLSITRVDGNKISHDDAQRIANLFFQGVPKGLIYARPAEYSVHYYVAHDLLVGYLLGNFHTEGPR